MTPSVNDAWMVREPPDHGGYRRTSPIEVDPLTGLLNREGMESILHPMIKAAHAGRASFSLALFDVDRFRRVNAGHGRERGDEILRQLTQVMLPLLRSSDRLARWDGDDFLLLAPATDLRGSLRLAERIRAHVGNRAFEGIDQITLSAGVACWRPDDTLATLLRRLERRHAVARNGGRNQVSASD